MELAIDTSTNIASIALADHGEIVADLKWQTHHNHTVELIPRLRELLDRNQAVIRDIRAIIIASGPGSFNGLRVGMATAKGLAYALDCHLVAVGTLEAIAIAHAESAIPVCPILPAGRQEIATATFRKVKGEWKKTVSEYITTISALSAQIKSATLFCGEITEEQKEELLQSAGGFASFPGENPACSRAGYLAVIGWCKIEADETDEPSTIQPLYLRKPSITRPKRRKNDAMSDMRARA